MSDEVFIQEMYRKTSYLFRNAVILHSLFLVFHIIVFAFGPYIGPVLGMVLEVFLVQYYVKKYRVRRKIDA